MSNFIKTTDFAAKDALTTGDPNKIVSGIEIDSEFNNIASASATKSNKKIPATASNLATLDASGDLGDSGFKLTGVGGVISADASELNKMDGVTSSTADLNAIENFEEVISATTLEVTIATGKTVNISDDSGLKLNEVVVTATASELNICDNPNTANKALKLDGSGLVPLSNLPSNITITETFTGTTSKSSGTWSTGINIILTDISTVYGIIVGSKTTGSAGSQQIQAIASDGNMYGFMNTSPVQATPLTGSVNVYLYNGDTGTETITYKITVIGVV